MIRRLLRRRHQYRCTHFVEAVTDYLEGALPRAEQARLERHLEECAGCARHLAQIRTTIALTGRLTIEDVERWDQGAREELMAAFRDFHAGGR